MLSNRPIVDPDMQEILVDGDVSRCLAGVEATSKQGLFSARRSPFRCMGFRASDSQSSRFAAELSKQSIGPGTLISYD